MSQVSAAATTSEGVQSHPGWFGAVMSTAILASILNLEATIVSWAWLTDVAAFLLILTSLLSVVLVIPYLRRLRARGPLLAEIGDPVRGPMLATFPAGVVLLASAWGTVGPAVIATETAMAIDAVLVTVGAVLALGFSVLWNASTLRGEQGLSAVNGTWLIPPTCLALVPIALSPLIQAWPDHAVVLGFIGMLFFGAGLVIALAMLAVLVARLILHPKVAPALAPSMWVPLAPGGVLGIACIRLAVAENEAAVVSKSVIDVAALFALIGLGFAVWWALFATVDLVRMRRTKRIPFQPGWWAFLFPPSAVVLSFMWLQDIFDITELTWLTVVLVAGLLVLWAVVLLRSIPLLRDALR